MLNPPTIRRRIINGYALTLGLALVGTIAGLAVGDHYQREALEFSRVANAEGKLVSDLQVSILYNRPAKQLSPYLNDPVRFQAESQKLLTRLERIETLLRDYRLTYGRDSAADSNVDQERLQLQALLLEYETTVVQFHDYAQRFIQEVEGLPDTPEGLKTAQQRLLALVQSPEFVAFIEFPDQLVPFADYIDQKVRSAEITLQQAERLRTWIILSSLMVSVGIAIVVALVTSQAIASPVQAVTQVARQVTEENNFDLQVAVEGEDEVGTLAKSLNQLIQQVKQLLTQLGQKNSDLEIALEQLNQQQVQLVQSEKMSSLGQLVAGVAHEINNPVNFIHGNLTHVQRHVEDLLAHVQFCRQCNLASGADLQTDTEKIDLEFIKEDLSKILHSMNLGTERIRKIVLSLRSFARMDEAECKTVDIHEGLESTLLILQHRLQDTLAGKAIQVMREYGDLPGVECYPRQLNQVFMHILTNAIDALEDQQAHPSDSNNRQITLRTSVTESQWAQIEISDNGPGMSEATQRRVFDPFFTTKPVGHGTGLGMSISYQIITQNHGGKLTCVSTLGQGTTFVIQIPKQQRNLERALDLSGSVASRSVH